MNIYLIRHGDAEKSAIGKKDFDRNLTEEGKRIIRNAAAGWKKFIPGFDFIITSPFTRALNTANIITETYDLKNDPIIDKKISPGSKTEDIIEIANSLAGENIAFVGHQPDFSTHLSNMISYKVAGINFKKAAIAKVSFDSKAALSKGTLEFLIPPCVYK